MSAATDAAKSRRVTSAPSRAVKTQWFIKEVHQAISLTLKQRTVLGTEYLKDQMVKNLSVAVDRDKSGRVTVRSKPGEFPRAETTQLLKTIFTDYEHAEDGSYSEGYVGSPLDYSLILETQMNRSFFVRTLDEEIQAIRDLITGSPL